MRTTALLPLLLLAVLPVSAQYVTVGDPGNPNDPVDYDSNPATNYGAVGYTYSVGTYEVTLNQYATFLNAVAATDTFALYNTNMGSDLNIAGISRTGSSGSYVYGVIGDGARPVTYVSFYDAMRYANWLGTGSTETGAYTLLGGTPVPSNGTTVTRNVGATVWIPSENEWYKAAYYDPSVSGLGDDYWLYPMRSDTAPTNNSPGVGTNRGNFYDGDYATTQSSPSSASQNYLTAVGAYTDSASYYGTFDQGGNVWEWNETIISSSRELRGGSWDIPEDPLRASVWISSDPTYEDIAIGFRIATVPEPGVAVSLMLTGAWLLVRRKRPAAV